MRCDGRYGAPFRFLDYTNGAGRVISGELPADPVLPGIRLELAEIL